MMVYNLRTGASFDAKVVRRRARWIRLKIGPTEIDFSKYTGKQCGSRHGLLWTLVPPEPRAEERKPQWQMIVDVAKTFSEPFTKEDLAVRCWKKHPKIFGLRGYDLPDAMKVFAKISAMRMFDRGMLRHTEDGKIVVGEAT